MEISSGVTGGERGSGAGGQSAPETSDWEISADLPGKSGKKWQGKIEKGENGEEKKGNCKRKGGKLKMEASFFLLFTFQNGKTLFSVYQNGNFLPGKTHFTPGKKIRKNDFAPSEKFSCYAPGDQIKI